MQYRNLMAKGPKKMLWGKEHIDRIGYHNYEEILREDRAMYDWMNGKCVNYSLLFQPRIFHLCVLNFLTYQYIYLRFGHFWVCYNQQHA